MRDHTKLRAFQKADALVFEVYQLTAGFPDGERFGLTSQLRRAAVSVASNVVEGCGRNTTREYLRFLEMAYSSAREVRYQLTVARRLHFGDQDKYAGIEELANGTAGSLAGLIQSLGNDAPVAGNREPGASS